MARVALYTLATIALLNAFVAAGLQQALPPMKAPAPATTTKAPAATTTNVKTVATSGSGSLDADGFPKNVSNCTRDQLTAIGSVFRTDPRKQQCEQTLKVKEMLSVAPTTKLCDQASCTTALQYLYTAMPDCADRDNPNQKVYWKDYFAELLTNCGKSLPANLPNGTQAGNTTVLPGEPGSGGVTASGSGSGKKNPVVAEPSKSDFAPVGVTTSEPPATTTTEKPKSAATSPMAVSWANVMTVVITTLAWTSL